MNTVRQTALMWLSPVQQGVDIVRHTAYQGMNTVRQTALMWLSPVQQGVDIVRHTAYQGMNTVRQTALMWLSPVQQGVDIVRHTCLSRHEYSETDRFNVVVTCTARCGHCQTHLLIKA